MFQQTRIKLTLWYLIIIMFISIFFSVVIYNLLNVEINRFEKMHRFRLERQFPNEVIFPDDYRMQILPIPKESNELIENTKQRILLMLTILNTSILFLSGVLAYFLAGRTLKPIKEMVESQNQFISDASHELRTPLTALKTAMEVSLRDKKFNLKEAKNLITQNIADVNRLQSLSDAMLTLTYETPSDSHVLYTNTSIKDIIHSAINRISPLALNKNIMINSTIPAVQIKANSEELTNLFVILLDNAIKYSPKNSTVEVSATKSNTLLCISITDQGVGINKKDLPHIFDRFYRSDSARTKTGLNGYGLGLAIAQKFAKNHHAVIKVISTPSKGSTFTLCLPLKK